MSRDVTTLIDDNRPRATTWKRPTKVIY